MTRTVLLWSALGSTAGFLVLAAFVARGPLPIDASTATLLAPFRVGASGALVDALTLVGQPFVWDVAVALLAAVLWARGWRTAAMALVVGLLGAEAVAVLAKIAIGRARPPGVEVVDLVTQASYPSGHVTRTVVTAGLLGAIAWPAVRWRAGLVALAVAAVIVMGAVRIASGEHWLTDVVGAVLFGGFALATVGLVLDVLGRPLTARAPPVILPRT